MNYQIADCRNYDPARLCAAMNAAFSDYVVPLSLTEAAFRTFQRQRGFSAEHSFVALKGDEIAAFWFAGRPRPDLEGRAYTLSVGTHPDHRRKGLSRQLLGAVVGQLKCAAGASGMQLEVITGNRAAISSYKAMGFFNQRTLRILKLSRAPEARPIDGRLLTLDLSQVPKQTRDFFDSDPTPQNSRPALEALSPDLHLLGVERAGNLVGWGAVYPDGAVAQLAVHRSVRRQGLGSALLTAMWQAAGVDALTFVNVDDGAKTMNRFLEQTGAEELLQQFEMQLSL